MRRRSLFALFTVAAASLRAAEPPQREFQLQVVLRGWSAERVRDQMAEPLEAWLMRLPGLTRFESQSAEHRYAVMLRFDEAGRTDTLLRAELAAAPALQGRPWTLHRGADTTQA